MALLASIQNNIFTTCSDLDTINLFGQTFQSELNRLTHAKPTVESGRAATLGSLDEHGLTPSRALFGADYVEVNRTLVGMLAAKWLLAGDYHSFTRFQNPKIKLRPASFNKLRGLLLQNLPEPEDIYALLVAIMINDLGKDDDLQRSIPSPPPSSINKRASAHRNHDEILFTAANAGLIPALESLPSRSRSDLILGLELGCKLNLAQLAQAENVPGSLKSMKLLRGNKRAFDLKYMEVLLDIAGAAGHIDSRCATQMSEPVFQSYLATHGAMKGAMDEHITLRQAYDLVLTARAKILQNDGLQVLSISDPRQRSLLRLMTMGRVADSKMAGCFAQAFDELDENIRDSLVKGLSADGLDRPAVIPYYAPGLIAEGLKNRADDSTTTKIRILGALMRFLARVYDHPTVAHMSRHPVVMEVDLSFAQAEVASELFKTNPTVLDSLVVV
ncbi:hypothetical protein FQN57_005898 [Myotisia sp. PD_48]|nr:hypothetical protein FQN57_005898 [Myotisia sp. PD_48]